MVMAKKRIKTKNPKKLNLGCGTHKDKGFVGIDVRDHGQEILWDLRDGIPVTDSSIEEIKCNQVLEHMTKAQAQSLMLEIYRVCKNNAKVKIDTPLAGTVDAHRWGHISYWSENDWKGMERSAINSDILKFKITKLKIEKEKLCVELKIIK